MPDTPEISVFGSFGYGNLGDELVPYCFASLLSSLGVTQMPHILSRFDKPLPEEGVMRLSEGRAMIESDPAKQHEIFVVGGGIIEPRPMSSMNRAFMMADGLSNTALRAFAVSVEPGVPFGFRDKRKLRQQLDRLGPVAVRDDLSARTLSGLAPGHPIYTVGDIALWTEPSGQATALGDAIGSTPGIVVILQTTWSQADFFPWMVEELAVMARAHQLPITILPFAVIEEEDFEVHAALAKALRAHAPDIDVITPAETVAKSEFTLDAIAAVLEAAKLCVSMRLHGCIVSYAQRTPFVALAYHPKLRGFSETVNWRDALLPKEIPAHQTKDVYGFKFTDLGLQNGDLVRRAEDVIHYNDFSGIEFYRQRQKSFLREIL